MRGYVCVYTSKHIFEFGCVCARLCMWVWVGVCVVCPFVAKAPFGVGRAGPCLDGFDSTNTNLLLLILILLRKRERERERERERGGLAFKTV